MNTLLAKKILGNKTDSLSNLEIESLISKFEYLAEGFLDNYEKQIFQGKTLKQLLQNE